jgi:hypothetical protein
VDGNRRKVKWSVRPVRDMMAERQGIAKEGAMSALMRTTVAAALIAVSYLSATAAGPGARAGAWLRACNPSGACLIQSQLRDADRRVTAAFTVLTEPNKFPKISVRFRNDPKFQKVEIIAFQIDDEEPHTFIMKSCGSGDFCGGELPIVSGYLDGLHRAKKVRTMLTLADKPLVVAEFDMTGYASVVDSGDFFTADELMQMVRSGQW